MHKLALSIFGLLLVGSMQGQSITGDWQGTLDFSGMKLRLVFHIQEATNGYTATMDSPDQGANGIPVEKVSLEGQDITISLPNLGVNYSGELNADGSKITGTFKQGAAVIPLELGRQSQQKQLEKRPQEPQSPFPYQVEEVRYKNPQAEGVTLAGTLTFPEGKGPFPAVILISGSGPQNRNGEVLGHKPFWVIADHFTRAGIAVLRFDERGIAESTGDFKTANSADFATDVQAGIDFLKTRSEIDADHIGLAGHSEGGLIAPMVAADNPDVDFIIMMAGPGVDGSEIMLLQQQLIARAEGLSEEAIEQNRKSNAKVFKALQQSKNLEQTKKELVQYVKEELEKLPEATKKQLGDMDKLARQQIETLATPWFRFFLNHDPKEGLKKVVCPVLAINGDKDLQVDATQNIPAIEKALKDGGNKQVTTKILPGLNHLFQHSETGRPSEYGQIEETFAPEALDLMTTWIKEQVN